MSATFRNMYQLTGWAAKNGGTTGGAGGPQVVVYTESAFRQAVKSTHPAIVLLAANISYVGTIPVGSSKTIRGYGQRVTIVGGGLTVKRSQNVIIQNLHFFNWTIDAVNIETSTNVWVDHNTFNHGADGCVDIKKASDFVTVSWNVFLNHNKVSLVGAGDNTTEDVGHLRVTYHHNWFNGTTQRHPRVRFGTPVHVYNNYYLRNTGNSIASTMNAGVLVEGNYFDHAHSTFVTQEGSSGEGNLSARDNVFVGCSPGTTRGTVESIPYAYTLEDPNTIVPRIIAGAGAAELSTAFDSN